MDGKESVLLTVSKMSMVEEVRKLVKEKLNVEPECQRLFFRGKQVSLINFLKFIGYMSPTCFWFVSDGRWLSPD